MLRSMREIALAAGLLGASASHAEAKNNRADDAFAELDAVSRQVEETRQAEQLHPDIDIQPSSSHKINREKGKIYIEDSPDVDPSLALSEEPDILGAKKEGKFYRGENFIAVEMPKVSSISLRRSTAGADLKKYALSLKQLSGKQYKVSGYPQFTNLKGKEYAYMGIMELEK